MKLTFFADQCVPNEIVRGLKDAGHEVLELRAHLPIRAADEDVIDKAQALDAILLSLNGDFADIVAFPPARFGGNVAIQLHNHPETIPQVMKMLLEFLIDHPDREFYRGKLLIVEAHRIRIRH